MPWGAGAQLGASAISGGNRVDTNHLKSLLSSLAMSGVWAEMGVAGDPPKNLSARSLHMTALGYLLEQRLPEHQSSLQAPAPPPPGGGGGGGLAGGGNRPFLYPCKPSLACFVLLAKPSRKGHHTVKNPSTSQWAEECMEFGPFLICHVKKTCNCEKWGYSLLHGEKLEF